MNETEKKPNWVKLCVIGLNFFQQVSQMGKLAKWWDHCSKWEWHFQKFFLFQRCCIAAVQHQNCTFVVTWSSFITFPDTFPEISEEIWEVWKEKVNGDHVTASDSGSVVGNLDLQLPSWEAYVRKVSGEPFLQDCKLCE